MLSFLFWNLKGRPLQEYIANLASLYKLDVIMLTECSIDTADLLRKLNPRGKSEYNYAEGRLCQKVKIFTRFSENFITTLGENNRMTIRHLQLPGKTDIILAVTHFYSKLYQNEENQARRCRKLINMIELEEKKLEHSRTILVGDLNMNPFDTGMIDATGMHSVMSRQIARKETRIIEGCTYKFFYNPMWGLLGDSVSGPCGTYFYENYDYISTFWHMFDQVLIRPELLDKFSNNDLKILDSDGTNRLTLEDGRPDKKNASDHLPIFFKLRL